MADTVNIYNFTSYRDFLRCYYEEKKSQGKSFSYRSFAKKCGFKSPNFLKLVIDGQRNLSPESIEKFVAALELSPKESQYFKALVGLNQETRQEVKEVYYEQLKSLAPHKSRRNLSSDSVEYLSHWLYPVIREMALLPGFRDDPYWIARRLSGKTSVTEIKNCLQFLVKSNFICKDEQGRFHCPDNVVLSSDEIKNFAIRQYHRAALGQAREALDLDLDDREFGAVIFTLPQDSLATLKEKLKSFRKDIHQWALDEKVRLESECEDCDDQVIQYNFQMFSQSKKAKKV